MKKILIVDIPDLMDNHVNTHEIIDGAIVGYPYKVFIPPTDGEIYQAFDEYKSKYPTSIIQVGAFKAGATWLKSLLK